MRSVGAALALLLMSCAPAQPGAVTSPADELRRLEIVWNEAHVRGDADALDRLWAEDFVSAVPGMAPMKKAAALAVWRAGHLRFQRYDTYDVDVRVFDDTAVVTGRLERTRDIGARTMIEEWYFTKTYARRNGVWRVVAFHASDARPITP
ncbi:MAG TPA: nuclear transport factor 2 family protein [Thermoanaerobaculia bacterium]|nr:nuclear transport factor 2 family protein [Thermoanaerobaculia bacterium]